MTKDKVLELYYERATNGRRFSAFLFDVFSCLLAGALLLLLTFLVLKNVPAIQNAVATREDIGVRSGLYEKGEDGLVETIDAIDADKGRTFDEKSQDIDVILTSFYSDSLFFDGSTGTERYLEYKDQARLPDGQKMFENGKRVLVNDDYDEDYYSFYKDCFEVARGYLSQNGSYRKANQTIFFSYTFSIVGTLLFPFPFFFLLVPLLFRRTRQTFGMRLCRIALVDGNGLALSNGKTVGRFLFLFLVEIVLSLFSFLVPLFVSVGMVLLSKTHQTLHDYVFNTYAISSDKATIYLDRADYLLSKKETKPSLSLEDREYKPVSGVDHEKPGE